MSFLLLFRKSNMVPDKMYEFGGKRQLKNSDIVIDDTNQRIVVGIRWSNNHQFMEELLNFPVPALPRSVLCPVEAVHNIRRLVLHNLEDHMFQLPGGAGSYTCRKFQTKLHKILTTEGGG